MIWNTELATLAGFSSYVWIMVRYAIITKASEAGVTVISSR